MCVNLSQTQRITKCVDLLSINALNLPFFPLQEMMLLLLKSVSLLLAVVTSMLLYV